MHRCLPIFVLAMLTGIAYAGDTQRAKHIELSQYWVRATIGTVPNTAAYLTIRSIDGRPDRLLRASSPAANKVELHAHLMQGGIARMRSVPSIVVPADKPMALAPGGLHLMLFGVKAPLKVGETIPLTLTFERAGAVTLSVPVRKSALGGTARKP